jgi:hypothetical protein
VPGTLGTHANSSPESYNLSKFYPTVLTVDSAKDDKKNLGASSKEKSFCLDSLSEMFSPPFLAKGN